MKEHDRKSVIITGGTRGIGRACVYAFARSGANILFTFAKSQLEAEALTEEIRKMGVDCLSIQADVRNPAHCKSVIEKALKKFGSLDILINNAGIIRDKALMMMLPEDWQEVLETNLGGTYNMSRAAITTFLKQKKGCIINISSVSGVVGVPRQTNYGASKAGIIGFSKALAKEVAGYGVRVNVVCPGYISTDMVESLREDIKKEIVGSIPQKRLGTAEEVGEVCLFLASDRVRYITGSVIAIDGGLSA